jgi:hypothetical protein
LVYGIIFGFDILAVIGNLGNDLVKGISGASIERFVSTLIIGFTLKFY